MGFVLSFIKVRYQPIGLQVYLIMPVKTFGVVRFMYHGIWPVEAVHAVCSLTSLISVPFGLYEASFFGAMEYSQLTVWIFMNSHTGFDIMITMAICWYLKTSVFIAYSVVFPYYAVFVHT